VDHAGRRDARLGRYVAALEYGTERRALVTGKPSRAFFGEAVRMLAEQSARPRTPATGRRAASPRREVAMVGDDLWNDIRGAQKAGLRGVFVRSGKHGDAELAARAGRSGAVARPMPWRPRSSEVVAALD
jgi:ribonucleotide monophosphatase NagD (HAD superfamily)